MKLRGSSIEPPKAVDIIIPRKTGDLHLKAKPILDYEPFEKMCPEPNPPIKHTPGQPDEVMLNDPGYFKKLDEYAKKRSAWMVIESLSATPGLEWDLVDPNDPDTFQHYLTDLRKSFNQGEQSLILSGINDANGVNESLLEEARERFLSQITLEKQ